MKRIYIAIAFIILTVSFAVFESYYISKQTDDMIRKIEETDNSVKENNFDAAYNTISRIQEKWEEKSWIIEIMLLHDSSDSINQNLSELSIYAKLENKDSYFPKSVSIKKQLTVLKESELLSLENIL